jgi:hypothetical protein
MIRIDYHTLTDPPIQRCIEYRKSTSFDLAFGLKLKLPAID